MTFDEKIITYKQLKEEIEALEIKKKALLAEILALFPPNVKSVQSGSYQVKRATLISVKMSLEEARLLDLVKIEEQVDKERAKALYKQGEKIPGISETHYIQFYAIKEKEAARDCPLPESKR